MSSGQKALECLRQLCLSLVGGRNHPATQLSHESISSLNHPELIHPFLLETHLRASNRLSVNSNGIEGLLNRKLCCVWGSQEPSCLERICLL